MKKSDKSIQNLTLPAIKRSLMKEAVCKFTKIYDTETMIDIPFVENSKHEELPIASTFVDSSNYSLITTRRVITQKDGALHSASFQDIKTHKLGDFKGIEDNPFTIGV